MQSPHSTSNGASPSQPEKPSRSVLIVDDEPGVRHLMRRWLESRGYQVVGVVAAQRQTVALKVEPQAALHHRVEMLLLPGEQEEETTQYHG